VLIKRIQGLKHKLLLLLMPPLIVLLGGELWLSYRELGDAANSAYDRSLAGAIKAIDASISVASGGLSIELPYTVLEFFQLSNNGRVFYRVSTEDGLVSLGNADLPPPNAVLVSNVPVFSDDLYFGTAVRIGSYARVLDKPLFGNKTQRVIIQIAETRESRTSFAHELLKQAIFMDALLVMIVAALLAIGIVQALRPLQMLRNEILKRAQDDMTSIEPGNVPLEVRPLVAAINHHISRNGQLIQNQKQFIEDASHQLRTPLSALRTQVDYALREPDIRKVREALSAMQRSVERSSRMVNQLLALARVNSSAVLTDAMDLIDVNMLAEDVARSYLPEARRRHHDFGFVAADGPIFVAGLEPLLREALNNLLENAIRYVGANGHITLSIDACGSFARLIVSDNGPGMPDHEKSVVGERFRRGRSTKEQGAGLGLAIAKEILELHKGKLELHNGESGLGLVVCMLLPRLVGEPGNLAHQRAEHVDNA
jgi:two-component system sensor histidine kinase TctE